MKKIIALIMASGQSRRMGQMNKLLLEMNDATVIETVVERFQSQPEIDEVVVVTSDQEIVDRLPGVRIVAGGAERRVSVYQGLLALEPDSFVLIHDGARPFVSQAVIDRCLEQARWNQAFCVAVPVTDTLKWLQNGKLSTPDRREFYAAQTPQGAEVQLLLQAYQAALERGEQLTDDASALEQFGVPVKLILGDYANRKITTPEDITWR